MCVRMQCVMLQAIKVLNQVARCCTQGHRRLTHAFKASRGVLVASREAYDGSHTQRHTGRGKETQRDANRGINDEHSCLSQKERSPSIVNTRWPHTRKTQTYQKVGESKQQQVHDTPLHVRVQLSPPRPPHGSPTGRATLKTKGR